jgi:hypothetical protein
MQLTAVSDPAECRIKLLFSDEDKCSADGKSFFEPNIKPGFNTDYLLSNNYICHFTSVRTDVLKKNLFRPAYDGAQDYDLFLRICLPDAFNKVEGTVRHIPRVLYHWRCHDASTAVNPASKSYAYDAGRNAVENVLQSCGINARAADLPHVGFYRISYPEGIFRTRKDIGAVGGRLIGRDNRISGGIYHDDGTCPYEGLLSAYSGGFTHIAACQQDCESVDLRCIRIRKNLRPLLKEITGLSYLTRKDLIAMKKLSSAESEYDEIAENHIAIPPEWDEAKIRNESIRFCHELRRLGYRILWDPQMSVKLPIK